ncbi:MAG: HDOD domain-containing protein [Leptospirales bacterium]|nr:HDOD domain-containing protein [Leptospirales bacterium]
MALDLDKIIIPPLSAVAFAVMRFNPDSETADSSGLERIIQPDEGVCTEILRVANSTFYGRSGRVKSLRDGITLIGLKSSRNLIILLSTRAMNAGLKGDTFTKYLNEFTVTCALVASELCEKLKLPQYKEEAFIGSLLHKIGMTVFALNKKADYADLIKQVEREFADLTEAERKRYQIDHVEIGRRVMERWNLPEQYRDVIANHNFAVDQMESMSDLVKVTSLASLASREMMGLLLSMAELDKKARLTAHLSAQDAVAGFNESYYGQVKEHAFYKAAVG